MNKRKKIVIILIAPPGGGKTTQAELLKETYGLNHILSSEEIKKALNDPLKQDDPIIQREKQLFVSGVLNTPEWVTGLIVFASQKVAKNGQGIVFSGSPRTIVEANTEVPKFIEWYGKENTFAFYITVSFEEGVRRIKERRLCEKCGVPVLDESLTACPKCGGAIIKGRALDEPEKLKIRFDEFNNRTAPVLEYLKQFGVLYEINGERSIELIFEDMKKIVDEKLRTQ